MPGMKHHPSCPDGFHAHLDQRLTLTIDHGTAGTAWIRHLHAVCGTDGTVLAVVLPVRPQASAIADRIAELLERHGLADVPDDLAAITAPWPAPDPNTRKENP